MLNARNGFVTHTIAALALVVAPAFFAVSADDQGERDAADMNARMQQKLGSKLGNGKNGGELDVNSKLSDRLNQKSEENNRRLDDHSNALTAADRSGKSDEKGKNRKDEDDESDAEADK